MSTCCVAALSGSDGASFLEQVGQDASDGGEGASDRGAAGESQSGSESESGTSEQSVFPGTQSAGLLEPGATCNPRWLLLLYGDFARLCDTWDKVNLGTDQALTVVFCSAHVVLKCCMSLQQGCI